MRKLMLGAALALISAASQAAEFFVVVPLPGKLASSAITVALGQSKLPDAEVGAAYNFNLKDSLVVTGDASYTGSGVSWRIASGSLPSGLSMSKDGVLSGVATTPGTSSFQVQALYKGKSGEQLYQVLVGAITVGLAPGMPPQALVGQAYSYDLKPLLTVSGDRSYTGGGVTWSAVSNSLPAGLSLTSAGVISGTPTAAGNGQLTARAIYKGSNGEQTYQVVSLNITVGLSDATLPAATQNTVYPAYDFKTLTTVTGDPDYAGAGVTFSAVGSLPAGLALSSDGVLSGTPTQTNTTGASFQVAASYRAQTGQHTYSLVINPQIFQITQQSGYKSWSDGSYAASCNAYRTGDATHTYAGATGTGVYRVTYNGSTYDAYCDMDTNGGGWMRIGYYNQASTTVSAAITNTSPSSNWLMPSASVPNFSTAAKLVKLTRQNQWVSLAASTWAANAASFSGYSGIKLTYNQNVGSQGNLLWLVTSFPYTVVDSFNPCGTGTALNVVMANATGAGTLAGIQVWQGACDSAKYSKQDTPFEVYSR